MQSNAIEDLQVEQLLQIALARLQSKETRLSLGNDLLRGIDERCRAIVKAVNNIRNTVRPVNRLPPEVLVRIFLECVLTSVNSIPIFCNAWNPPFVDMEGLLHIAQVCRDWRGVVLATQELWSSIRNEHLLLRDAQLVRSQSVPLRFWLSGSPWTYGVSSLKSYSHRMLQLCWCQADIGTSCSDETLFFCKAPTLKYLAISGPFYKYHGYPNIVLFENHTPSLTHLTLFGLGWVPVNSFPSLTHLHIEDCDVDAFRLSLLLSGTPSLVDLILRSVRSKDIFPRKQSQLGRSEIQLPYLRRLVLHDVDTDSITVAILDARLNPDVAISFICRADQRASDSWTLEYISERRAEPAAVYDRFYLSAHFAIIGNSSSAIRMGHIHYDRLAPWTFVWAGFPSMPHIREFWMVNSIDTPHPDGRDLLYLRKLFGSMKSLETLYVHKKSLQTVVDVLSLFRDPREPPICPELSTMHIFLDKKNDMALALHLVHGTRIQLGIKHLRIKCMMVSSIDDDTRALAAREFETFTFECIEPPVPMMHLPSICLEEVPGYWPPWDRE